MINYIMPAVLILGLSFLLYYAEIETWKYKRLAKKLLLHNLKGDMEVDIISKWNATKHMIKPKKGTSAG